MPTDQAPPSREKECFELLVQELSSIADRDETASETERAASTTTTTTPTTTTSSSSRGASPAGGPGWTKTLIAKTIRAAMSSIHSGPEG
ncbi:hypothetical protein XA68_11618 [Ophiocordyceps unilateralis]|uniref:Uncharacterized protein n=1 Tax=Ophiocordyceps unilateralis TaxID=268505 RepID=A0A2A9PPQ4_OPHUN|nr:hypothetical protein XA68_11618 [Ophiocordyceps unilateralis]